MTYVSRTQDDDALQAVTVVIGVMLMISILFLAAAQYQLVIVPQQEETAEINHHREVSTQMGQLRTDILAGAGNDAQAAQKLDMGTEYSQDLIFGIIPEVHQPNPTGTIKSEGFSNKLIIRNAEGVGSSRNYWPGGLSNPCGNPNHCYETTSFHYSAEYNRFTDNPTLIYENTLLYDYYDKNNNNDYDAADEYRFHADQNVVNGRSINLVTLTGSLEQSRVSPANVQVVPVSAPSQTITIKGSDTGDPVTADIPTRLPASIWENKLLADQMASQPGGYIESVTSCGPECVRLTMIEDEVYNLKLARVHLTTREEQSNTPNTKAAYIAWKGNDRTTIRESSTTEINAQVRDRYNNAVPGIKTTGKATDQNGDCIGSFRSGVGNNCQGTQQPGEQTSGEDGTLTYYYVSPDVDSDTAITIQLKLNDPDNTVSADGTQSDDPILMSAYSEGEGDFHPNLNMGHLNPSGTLRITNVDMQKASLTSKQKFRAFITFDNTGPDRVQRSVSITGSGSLSATPDTINVDLQPGEHKQYTTVIRIPQTGSQTIQFSGLSTTVNVEPPSTGLAQATIKNRNDKERIQKSPSHFKDGDAIKNEYRESQNIPPVEYNNSDRDFQSTANGNLYQFQNIGDKDNQYTYVDANTSDPTISDSLNVGLATSRIAPNDVYTLFMNYDFAGSANYVKYSLVNSSGHAIDPNSNYYLKNDDSDTQRAYQLTNKEAEFVRQSSDLYAVIHTPNGDYPKFRIDRTRIVSSRTPLELTTPQANLIPDSTVTTESSVTYGTRFVISGQIENTGTGVAKKEITLFRTNNGAEKPVRTHTVYVNPGQTKTVSYVRYVYNPGTYQYSLGTSATGTTNPVTVTVTHEENIPGPDGNN